MIVSIETKLLKKAIDKLCQIASVNNLDSYASQIKASTENNFLYLHAIDKEQLQSLVIKMDNSSCSVHENGEVCIPAKTLQQIVSLLDVDNIELSTDKTILTIKPLPSSNNDDDEKQIIEGIDPSLWSSAGSVSNEYPSLLIERDSFINAMNMTNFSCSSDKSKAPLTAIYAKFTKNNNGIYCVSSDHHKVSIFEKDNCIIKSSKFDNDIITLIHSDIASKIKSIFTYNIDNITLRIQDNKISILSGDTCFTFATEVGVDNYPPLWTYLEETMYINYDVDLEELKKCVGLVSAVAPLAASNLVFSEKISISTKQKYNYSKKNISPNNIIKKSNDDYSIKVSTYDLITAINKANSINVNIGLTKVKDHSHLNLFEIKNNVDSAVWRHLIFKSIKDD